MKKIVTSFEETVLSYVGFTVADGCPCTESSSSITVLARFSFVSSNHSPTEANLLVFEGVENICPSNRLDSPVLKSAYDGLFP